MKKVFDEVQKDDLVSIVRDRIKEAILAGTFAPGQKIAESDIARQMDVSRAPIREAARLLERQGLLVAKKNAGFFIRPMERRHIDEIYEMRIILQTAAIRLAVSRVTDEDIASLEEHLAGRKAAAQAHEPRDYLKDLVDFQLELCRCSGNERLTRVFAEISDEIRLILSWVGIVYRQPAEVFDRFDEPLAALRGRNEAWAASAIEGFVRRSWRETIDKFEQGNGLGPQGQN